MVEVLTHGQIMKKEQLVLEFYNAFKGVDYNESSED